MRTEIQAVSTPKENIVLPTSRLPFQHTALRQKPRFGKTPTDTAGDSESNLDNIAAQPDTARSKSPMAKIPYSNDNAALRLGLPVLEQEQRGLFMLNVAAHNRYLSIPTPIFLLTMIT